MRKLTPLLALLFLAASCGKPSGDGSLADNKASLEEKKKELAELQAEIKTLEEKINSQDTTSKAEKLTPVATKKVQTTTFNHYLQITGTVSSQENVLLSAESMGRVVSIPVKEGQKVSKGQTLVALNADALKEQLQEAQASYDLAKTTFKRRQRLWKDSIGSEIQYLNAQTQFKAAKNRLGQIKAQLDNSTISSPINGRVDEITVNTGEFLAMGTPVVRVVDMENLEVEAEISEDYLGDIQVGDSVHVTIDALGLEQVQPVIFTSQYINPNNRSFKIKVKLNNSNQLIKPNLLASLRIRDYQNPAALAVPSMAIKQDLTGEYLFVIEQNNGENVVAKRYITKGLTSNDQTEVLEGLTPSDLVVTSGYNLVAAGQAVTLK